ncbi:hypothetical protein CELL_01823 [Cellulomonas sp. T2.31MG-18]|uniref:hypothetical protein n=1 Tax=Cellulomonas sp. T2.31MG-18 TaxID=3157619 RepID=UPI0035F000BC
MTASPTQERGPLALAWFGLAGLAVAVVFAGLALAAWRTPVITSEGYCGRAVTFHPGAGQLSGGEMTTADREAITAECRAAGAAAWDAGRRDAAVALLGAAVAGTAAALRRRTLA